MGRCRSRCWLARRMRGRSRGSSIDISRTSSASRSSSSRTGRRSTASSGTRSRAGRRCSGDDRHLRRPLRAPRAWRRPPSACRHRGAEALVLRRALSGASLNGLGPSARFSGFGETLRRRSPSSSPGSSTRTKPAGTWRRSTVPIGRSSSSSSSPTGTSSAGTPSSASRASRRLGGPARARVRFRRPDRRAVGPGSGARRPDGRRRLAPVRARTPRLRLARPDGRRPGRPRGRAGGGAAARVRGDRPSGARASRADALQRG